MLSKILPKYFRKTRNIHLFFLGCILIFIAFYFLPLPACIHEREGFDGQDQNPPNMEYLNNQLKEHREKSKFPYRYLSDENGNTVPVVLVSAFFRDDDARDTYQEYLDNGIRIAGITAYKSFPKQIDDVSEDKYHHTDDFQYTKKIKNWLCCFKNPGQYGLSPNTHNLVNISESDFYNVDEEPKQEKKYDVLYVCLKDHGDECPRDGWNAINRNFDLAEKCLPILINDFGLRVLAVGRIGCGLEEKYGDKITTTDFLPYHEFQEKIRECKMLFMPNVYDASPRVVPECITKGLPVLMNKSILCGTKYITPETGELFTDEHDIKGALEKLLSKKDKMHPEEWWKKHYGRQRMGEKMRDFLHKCFPGVLNNTKEVYF